MAQKLLHYDVIKRLGEGAKSTIYAVTDPATRNIYALKHVVRKEDKDIRFIEQMQAEYDVAKHLNHPNVRKCFELKIHKSMLLRVSEAFLLMELVDGQPLDENLPRSMVDLVDGFIQVAEGLRAMHQQGFVHCDIKPINILRNDAGRMKVIDFGQSCKVGTVKERIQGTPDYISPEQVARKPVDARTDVFNLGATMYWSLVGKTIPTLYTVNKKGDNSFLLDSKIDTPQQLNPRVPTPLNNLVMESVSTNPAKRPPNMDQVIQRLELVKHVLLKQANPAPQPGSEGVTPMP